MKNVTTIHGDQIHFTDKAPTEDGAYWCCPKGRPEFPSLVEIDGGLAWSESPSSLGLWWSKRLTLGKS